MRSALSLFALVLVLAPAAAAQLAAGVQVGHATGISARSAVGEQVLLGAVGIDPWAYRMNADVHLLLGRAPLKKAGSLRAVYGPGAFVHADDRTTEVGLSALTGLEATVSHGQEVYLYLIPRLDVGHVLTPRFEAAVGFRVDLLDDR